MNEFLLLLSVVTKFLFGYCVLAIPLLLCIAAFLSFRGLGKWLSLVACAPMFLIYVLEVVSYAQQGNLTGLMTFLVAVPLLLLVLVANTIQGLIERRSVIAIHRTDVA